ncbi:hypothetical protein GRF59_26090 [Paenibacillus sp. HJL G12]|uniref:Uncharacterized protein n=1 Tax=Paenibacillus dendrobii TaxID=2691084 RepID=A0A7X3IPJ8_9BACL|nr:hypothetical protein [Paenibacillus dendrobii]MWV47071.1 hypothetical protein [Paenibacillus dendrobii]
MKFTKSAFTAAALIAAISLQAGAGATHAAGTTTVNQTVSASTAASAKTAHANAVYNHMMSLLKSPSKQAEAVSYMEKNIYQVTPWQGSMMVLKLENAEKAHLDAWNDKFFKDSIQTKLMKLMKSGDDLTALINKTNDKSLKSLFKGARDSGYRIDTSEGMYYLVLDYPRFQKVRSYVSADIKSYIDIMTAETKAPFANDAALSIGWTEVTKRALAQEAFVKSFPHSNRTAQVKSLFNQYLSISMSGLNNTPLFDYDTKKVDAKAKAALQAAVSKGDPTKSGYIKKLQGFLDVLKKNNDTLTPEVDKYRKAASGM